MKMNLSKLCLLDWMNDDNNILARCISIWKSYPLGKPNEVWSLDVVLQDQQGIVSKPLLRGSLSASSNFYWMKGHVIELGTTITRVGSFDNNPHGFKFEHFTAFIARKFTEIKLCDVIGTVMSDAILFNNFGKDQLRRTIILEDV
nr:replication protein A 70 kDa DNA-binding subunit B [Tanacetum cinerariifolium]